MKLEDLTQIDKNIDINKYINFREYVKSFMEYPEWLGDFSYEDLTKLLNSGSRIWMYYQKDIAVCSMMLIPATKKDIEKFGVDIDYNSVADYGPMMVNPKFVGNGLQYQMLKYLDTYCKNNNYNYALSTIHPDNIYSINNLIKDNFKLVNHKVLKRGPRNVYLKKY